jgi:hypothetical protein
MEINLSARRFFLRFRLKQCGRKRKRKLIRGFERDGNVHAKSRLARGLYSAKRGYRGKAKPWALPR